MDIDKSHWTRDSENASSDKNADERRTEANVGRARAEARAQTAETGRIRAERERNEANLDRVQAESDRDRAEAARTRAEEQRAQGELLMAVLAHDLRNPLAAITTSAQLLRREGEFEREEDRRTVERIARVAARVARMVDQLLDFARTRNAHGIPIMPRDANLAGISSQVVDEIRQLHSDREVRLDVSGDTEGWWDPDRVAQVADNLISNGLQYGARDTPVEVSVSSSGRTVTLEVRNRGLAIDADTRRMMFDPFARTSERTAGLGLGLYIVQQIVLAHGGTIDVDSSDADGTVFRVQLPRG
jgi:signal transduction histidine kinase